MKNVDQLQEARRSVGFERSADGRVLLLTEDGEPFQVKADMGVPGMLLLRWVQGFKPSLKGFGLECMHCCTAGP